MEILVSCQRRLNRNRHKDGRLVRIEKNQAARRCGIGVAAGNASVDWPPSALFKPSTIRSRWTSGSSV